LNYIICGDILRLPPHFVIMLAKYAITLCDIIFDLTDDIFLLDPLIVQSLNGSTWVQLPSITF